MMLGVILKENWIFWADLALYIVFSPGTYGVVYLFAYGCH